MYGHEEMTMLHCEQSTIIVVFDLGISVGVIRQMEGGYQHALLRAGLSGMQAGSSCCLDGYLVFYSFFVFSFFFGF
jgi:hypothetical protein